MSSLKEFIAAVKTEGLIPNNRFSVEFFLPTEIQASVGFNSFRNVLMFCDQTQLPGVNLSSSQVRIFGEMQESPYEKLYDPVNLSFLVDNNARVITLFDTWMNYIQSGTDRTFRYLDDYSTPLTINVYDRMDKLRYSKTMFKAYPKTISSINLDYAGRDVMRLNVTFSYKYYANNLVQLDGTVKTNVDNLMVTPDSRLVTFGTDINSKVNDYLNNFDNFQNMLFDTPVTDEVAAPF